MERAMFDFILNSFDIFIISRFLNKVLFTKKGLSTEKIWLFTIALIGLTVVSMYFLKITFDVMLNVVPVFTVLCFYPKNHITTKLCWGTVVIAIEILSEGVCYAIMNVCFPNVLLTSDNVSYYYEAGALLSKISKFSFFLWVPLLFKIDVSQRETTLHYLYMCLYAVPIITLCLSCSHFDLILRSGKNPNEWLSVISMIGVLSINIIMLIIYEQLSRMYGEIIEQELLNFNLKAENIHYDNLEKSQKEIRRIKHDMKNELLTLKGLLKENNVEAAEGFIEGILSDIKCTETQKYTPNNVLNYVLTEKINLATKKSIVVNVDSFLPEKFSLNNNIIAVVFGNLLDNAIEGCDKVTVGKKTMDIKLKYHEKQLYIEISNTFNPLFVNSNFISNKKNRKNHGFGLKSVKQIVKENSGILDIRTGGDRFCVNIILWDLE
ncbi:MULTISPECIES: sensor histidine kinase [Paenibacillus]|nr:MULTISPECIES: GHKL domain-containing protein [Paenibacillus]KAF6583895.1 sensor histidine kinase [Paenibacillus sp. EKM211P]KJD40146.1 histidine kinase [Paenibacillus polymyxa]